MNGGNESSGADRAGGPVATSVPIGWQRCVREGAVLYIRCGSPKFPSFYPQALQLPKFSLFYSFFSKLRSLVPCCSLFLFPPQPFCSLCLWSCALALSIFFSLPFLGRSLNL